MRKAWKYQKSKSTGAVIRQLVNRAYSFRDMLTRTLARLDLMARWNEAYRYYMNKRRLRSHIASDRMLLIHARQKEEGYSDAFDHNPLVSVIIPTWNRGELLISRTLPSVLNQTYQHLEIIIVGDCCTDKTAALIASIGDPRLHFFNLPERGEYPSEKKDLWQVAGSAPKNRGLEMASGTWISPLDDDDVFTPDHIESLLRYAQMNDLELVYGKLKIEESTGRWKDKGRVTRQMSIQNSTMLFRSYLKLFRSDINAWRYGLTVDYQRTIRYRETGVRIGYLNQVVALMPLRPGQTRIGFSADDRPGEMMSIESAAMVRR
jgi:hypothetical protein